MESKLYLNFFKSNIVLIAIFLVVFAIFGFYYQDRKPSTFSEIALLEMAYDNSNVSDRISLTDQAVTLARSENINQSLGIDRGVVVTIFKPGPLSIQISVSSDSQDLLDSNLSKISSFLGNKFQIKEVGSRVNTQDSPNKVIGVLIGGAFGLALGILVSLIKSYLKNY